MDGSRGRGRRDIGEALNIQILVKKGGAGQQLLSITLRPTQTAPWTLFCPIQAMKPNPRQMCSSGSAELSQHYRVPSALAVPAMEGASLVWASPVQFGSGVQIWLLRGSRAIQAA